MRLQYVATWLHDQLTRDFIMFSSIDASLKTGLVVMAFVLMMSLYELATGAYRHGKKSREDWLMGGICISALAVVQRPLLFAVVFFSMAALFPGQMNTLSWIDSDYFFGGLIAFFMVDEFLHGAAHKFAHMPKVRHPLLARVQSFYRQAHRPHHLVGGNDGKGELSATHTFVEGWAWWLFLPNYSFGFVALYFGLTEIFLWATLIKTVWGVHVHTNWNYDLYLLNHPNKWVRNGMYAVCHVITFPTMHQHHHSRGKNSAKNMQNVLALWDWLFWGLTIETERPKTFGWRQRAEEERSALYRFFHTSFSP